jgi:hypothetical protein
VESVEEECAEILLNNKNYTNSFAFEFSRIKEQLLRAWTNINIIHVIIFFILYNNFILKWSLKGIISYIYIHCQEETRITFVLYVYQTYMYKVSWHPASDVERNTINNGRTQTVL